MAPKLLLQSATRALIAATAAAAAGRGLTASSWPSLVGDAQWAFDRGSAWGFRLDAKTGRLAGPAPDWALGAKGTPWLAVSATGDGSALNATSGTVFPGLLQLRSERRGLTLEAAQVFSARNSSLLRLRLRNTGTNARLMSIVLLGAAPNATRGTSQFASSLVFDLPGNAAKYAGSCYNQSGYGRGALQLPKAGWKIELTNAGSADASYVATGPQRNIPPTHSVEFYVMYTFGMVPEPTQPPFPAAVSTAAFDAEVGRWDGYVSAVLRGKPTTAANLGKQYVSVKAMQTLLHNWRFVPGSANEGVLPSYVNYDSGMWSWDTYKQAVGMVAFAPELAKSQLRVLVAGRDMKTGHIPDKIDRCGVGGGCAGKPPLLSWSVWEVYTATQDRAFLAEMYPRIEQFHDFWYAHRDVQGIGLCSWTGGMESGMDDGIRFINASHASNASSHVSAFNFHSVDLNSYLYRDKLTLAKMAKVLGNVSAASMWSRQAAALLPRLQKYFFNPSGGGGNSSYQKSPFFQDKYYTTAGKNLQRRSAGQFVPVQGCEGYAALFCEVATPAQAAAVATTLADPQKFLLNFSLPTASMANPNFGLHSYWKGSTWIDQVWFAYTGLQLYGSRSRAAGDAAGAKRLSSLAQVIKVRTFLNGQGFGANDTTPLNEHYDPQSGQAIGAPHFSWTSAHVLLWTGAEFDAESEGEAEAGTVHKSDDGALSSSSSSSSSTSTSAAAAAVLAPLFLTGDTPWIVPPELSNPSEGESDALNDTAQTLALRDVELDWYKVLGYRAVIYANSSFGGRSPLAKALPPSAKVVVFFGDADRHPYLEAAFNLSKRGCGLEQGKEAHCLLRLDNVPYQGQVLSSAVVAVGNGTRGSIYAAYALSELLLGVAPFYKFQFDQPLWTGMSLPISAGFKAVFAPPQFTHRTIFLNDEELLGFFRRDPLGEQIFDPSTCDMILEALLRAKGNAIIFGTTPYPDERSLKLAARRGVVITASHFEILGFNAFAWSQSYGKQSRALWDWSKHPDVMANAWNASIYAQKDYEMIWSVGLRGLNDYAYPNCISRGTPAQLNSSMGCGNIISEAVGNQTQLLAAALGKPIDELHFKFNLWVEALPLYEKGLLKLPKHTSLVMSDSGAGFIRGNDDVFANADGVYYHVQMLNGNGGQLTEFVPPSRIFEQLSAFVRKARSTSIFVLNLSDLKPAVLSAAAALRFVWDPRPFTVNGSASAGGVGNQSADQAEAKYMAGWSAQNFAGASAAQHAQIARLWTAYFDLPWVAGGSSDEMLGGSIGGIASGLASDLSRKGNFSVSLKTQQSASRGLNLMVDGGKNASAIHAAAAALLPQLPARRQQFFRSHLLVQSAIQRFCVEAIAHLGNATNALVASTAPPALQAAQGFVLAALASMDQLFAAERAAEGTEEWRGMYWADRHRFTNFQARRRQILALQSVLTRVQQPYEPSPQIDCCQMEYAYQWTPARKASYPLIQDNPEFRARDMVSVSCANVSAGGGHCENSILGGVFARSASVTLAALAVEGAAGNENSTILYSVDGSAPSLVYSAPLQLSKSTTIRAKLHKEGAGVRQERRAVFTLTAATEEQESGDGKALKADDDALAATGYSLDAYSKAKCLDGSSGRYYLRKGASLKKFLFFFEGGGFCTDDKDCLARSKQYLGTTKTDPTSVNLTTASDAGDASPLFELNSQVSPLLSTFTHVLVRYCDGAYYSGDRASPTKAGLHYAGRHITEAVIADLRKKHALAAATDIVFAGCSAGGIRILGHLDALSSMAKAVAPTAKVTGFADSGFYLDIAALFTSKKKFVISTPGQNASGLLNEQCKRANPGNVQRCLVGSVSAKFIQTPLFAWTSAYDHDQRGCEMTKACAASNACINAYGKNLSLSIEAQLLGTSARNGAFIDGCSRHCWPTNLGPLRLTAPLVPPRGRYASQAQGELNPLQAFAAWYQGQGREWRQPQAGTRSGYPCAKCCKP